MPGPLIYGAAGARADSPFRRSVWRRYAFGAACALIAAGVRWLVDPLLGERVPWVFFFPAVLFSAWYGGFGAGVFTCVVSVALAVFCWMPALSSFSSRGLELWTSVGGFLFGALLICWMTELSHRARRDLEFERRFLNAIVSSLTDGLVVLDRDWRYIYLNDAAAGLCRKSRAELMGRVVWEVSPELRDTALKRELKRSRDEKVPVQFEMAGPAAELWYEFRAHPMDGSTAIYITDISRRKQTEMELAQTKDQLSRHAQNLEKVVHERTSALEETIAKLEESVAELERFSYTISHDLRAPLRAMQSFASFIAEDYGERLDKKAIDYLDRIQSAAQRMDQLINDVLLYTRTSRAEAGAAPVDLDKLVDAVVTQYTPASGAQVEICHPLGRVCGNEALLTQVISNLLVNAVKFVPQGAQPQVTVWSERTGGQRRLLVRDQGIGIPAEARNKVFGIFERAHGDRYPGTGVGLAIVKRAVERMNGKVAFTSEVGKGSTFWIELPDADYTQPQN